MRSVTLLAFTVVASVAIQTRLKATPGPLLFTEDGSTLTATIDGVPFGTITPEQGYWLLKMDPTVIIPLFGEGIWNKSWEYTQSDGTKIETLIHIAFSWRGYLPQPGEPYPSNYYYADIITGPEGPLSYVDAPFIPDGTVAPWTGQLANQWFSGIEFVNVADTATIPDKASTWLLFLIGSFALYANQRLGLMPRG